MLKYFTYNEYVENIFEIDLEKLYQTGKRLILTDLDNTLVGSDASVPTAEVLAWLNRAKEIGFVVKIASNNNAERVRIFAENLDINSYGLVYKPLAFKVRKYMKGYTKDQVVFIGDQLLTDVFVSKRLGLYMILVRPVKLSADEDITKFNRKIERWIVKGLNKRGLPVPPHII
jgi:HAD superfamily phosphatase (TIGR01668 family)